MNIKRIVVAAVCALMPMLGLSADLYVDCLLGHDSYAGTSARPKKTIPAAINAASTGDRILVSPDTYAPFNMDRRLMVVGILSDDATKQGDGQPWTPTITVKGGTSGFCRIKVGK